MRRQGRTWRHAVFAVTAGLFFLSCNPPTVDKPSLFPARGAGAAQASSLPLRERMLGTWEVIAVGGRPLAQVPEEEVPFRQVRIDRDGRLRMDTFQTHYEVAGEEDGVVSLSYSAIGRESFLAIRVTGENSAEIRETYLDPVTGQRGESQVSVRRIL